MTVTAIGNTRALQVAREQEFRLELELGLRFRVRDRIRF